MTEASRIAFERLRSPADFQWTLVPIFALAAQLYWKEIGRRNWHLVIACVGVMGLEFLAEVVNALILHWSGYAALWTIGGKSSFLVFVGFNVEIMMMFWVAYYAFLKILPQDPKARVLGLPNRWFFVIVNSLVCVVTESILNAWGVLVWEWHYWSWPHVWSVFCCAYAPSIVFLYWLHDLPSLRSKTLIAAGLWGLCLASFGVFSWGLGWI